MFEAIAFISCTKTVNLKAPLQEKITSPMAKRANAKTILQMIKT